MMGSPEVLPALTRQDLQAEFRIFSREVLEVEVSKLKQLQHSLHADLREMLIDLQRTLQCPHPSSQDMQPQQLQQPARQCATPSSMESSAKTCTPTTLSELSQTVPSVEESEPARTTLADCSVISPEDSIEVLKETIYEPTGKNRIWESSKHSTVSESTKSTKAEGSNLQSPSTALTIPGSVVTDVSIKPTNGGTYSSDSDHFDEQGIESKEERADGHRQSRHSTNSQGSNRSMNSSDEDKEFKKPVLDRPGSSAAVRVGRRQEKTSQECQAERLLSAPEPQSLIQYKLWKIATNSLFDYIVAGLILANGLLLGVNTHYLAKKDLEDSPTAFQVLEILFCILFTAELLVRLAAFRCSFFTSADRAWNIFDLIIVSLQLFEIFMSLVAVGVGFSFSILRILRLVRIIRLVRALRLIPELRNIVSSIANSVKPLAWTGVLLVLTAYVVGISLTQLVHQKRLSIMDKGGNVPASLEESWGDLFLSIFTLIQSITGGVDWHEVCVPLIDHIGFAVGLLFMAFILFCNLALLNVITGVFIDSVMENGKKSKEQMTKQHLHALFTALDVDQSGEIFWENFKNQLHKPEMQEFFRIVDVDVSNAKSLFELIDLDGSGSIDAGELMDGCLKIWSPAKDLDLRMVSRDVIRLRQKVHDIMSSLDYLPQRMMTFGKTYDPIMGA